MNFFRGDKYSSKRTRGRVWALVASGLSHKPWRPARWPRGRSFLRRRRRRLRAGRPAVPLRPVLQLPFLSVARGKARVKAQGARRQGCTRGPCANRYGGRSEVWESPSEPGIRSTRGPLSQRREAKPRPAPAASPVTVLRSPFLRLWAGFLDPRAGTARSLWECGRPRRRRA